MNGDLFKKANELWFDQGRTKNAVEAYERARHAAPDDPVVAFQYARVMWSLDRFDESRLLLEQAHIGRQRLTSLAQVILDQWRSRLQEPTAERHFPEVELRLLDRDVLESESIEVIDWRAIADAAADREMYGVAAFAMDQWRGVPIDAEDSRDIGRIWTNRSADLAMLAEMRIPSETSKKTATAVAPPDRPERLESHETSQRSHPPAKHATTAKHDSETQRPLPSLPDLPLELTVHASPHKTKVGAMTTLVATLTNQTDATLIVNRRMLINNRGAPGEVWLDVRGPEGHVNSVGFRIRAGRTPDEFFVSLRPGQSVSQSWTLNDYCSLNTPGEYEVTLTYHNERAIAPSGKPMSVGKVSGSTRFIRSA